MSASVTIIGGGQAGASLAKALRARGYDGRVTLVCRETELPYERPPLSKGVLSGQSPTGVLPEAFYDNEGVDLHLGRSAVQCRKGGSQWAVDLDDGEQVFSDTVVLATGSRPRRIAIPGADLDGVVYLNTTDDARDLRHRLLTIRRAVVAGAGLVGTEVAATLRAHDVEVMLVDPVERPLERALGPWAAAEVRELHARAGVKTTRDVLAEIRGSGVVEMVVTGSGGELDCDLVLVAVGSRPATELAAQLGLESPNGVDCDHRGRTGLPGLYAMGDVASWQYETLGRLRVEHFRTAIEHADVVAADIVGDELPRALVPWFWTDQYDRRVEVAGCPTMGERTVRRRTPDGSGRITVHLRRGRVMGAIGLDAPRQVREALQLIRQQSTVDPVLIEDPATDLRKVVTIA